MNAPSTFARALKSVLDDTNMYDRDTWAARLNVSRQEVDDWTTDRSIPKSQALATLYLLIVNATIVEIDENFFNFVCRAPINSFLKMLFVSSMKLSPHGDCMLPTPWSYMLCAFPNHYGSED